jgi:hypothetical protein
MTRDNKNPSTTSLMTARFKYWGWWILSKCMLGVVCVGVISEGIRLMVPALGMKLHRVPGFAFAKHYDETHGMDIAPFLAFFFMILTWHLAEKALRVWLLDEPLSTDGGRWNTEREELLLKVLGAVLLSVDCILFYAASATMTWGGSFIAFAPLIATAGYLAVVLGVSYVSAKLSVAIDAIKELIALEEEERRDMELERRFGADGDNEDEGDPLPAAA